MIPCKPGRRALPLVAALAAMAGGTAPARAEAAPAGCTGTPSATWIDVAVEGVANGNGLIAITLYADNPRKFLVKHGSLYVGRVPARAGTTTGCIYVPEPGVYAIAIYHDENASQTFDRTGLGLPAEGYGFSNNPSTLAGLPSFRSVRLSIPRSGLLTRIRIKYP
ncbi:DUF2141 domain-containing protein [Novosphingobium sp.]|uniref:DUF2141 domain-containing protein n=1 Tax=Novosphingobium sp. TaxID=1874826 RepID=UPI002630E384|nr:DUF2141 domain-containing protein [Novosphingobium sp.]